MVMLSKMSRQFTLATPCKHFGTKQIHAEAPPLFKVYYFNKLLTWISMSFLWSVYLCRPWHKVFGNSARRFALPTRFGTRFSMDINQWEIQLSLVQTNTLSTKLWSYFFMPPRKTKAPPIYKLQTWLLFFNKNTILWLAKPFYMFFRTLCGWSCGQHYASVLSVRWYGKHCIQVEH